MMRRYGWLVFGLGLLALWAWSQRTIPASAPVMGSTPAAQQADRHAPLATLPADGSASRTPSPSTTPRADTWPGWLPGEALDTLQLIARGGPYPHRQDGTTFQNRERLLPSQPRGWYREYTVRTPGSRDRGARRIIAGGDPPVEFFYTEDHYRSFRRFAPAEASR